MMKKLEELLNKIKSHKSSDVYYIPGWDKSILEYSARFIAGEDPKIKKESKINEQKKSN